MMRGYPFAASYTHDTHCKVSEGTDNPLTNLLEVSKIMLQSCHYPRYLVSGYWFDYPDFRNISKGSPSKPREEHKRENKIKTKK